MTRPAGVDVRQAQAFKVFHHRKRTEHVAVPTGTLISTNYRPASPSPLQQEQLHAAGPCESRQICRGGPLPAHFSTANA